MDIDRLYGTMNELMFDEQASRLYEIWRAYFGEV